MSQSIGVIGLGAMGNGVARSLLRAGFKVHACDLRAEVRSNDPVFAGQPADLSDID